MASETSGNNGFKMPETAMPAIVSKASPVSQLLEYSCRDESHLTKDDSGPKRSFGWNKDASRDLGDDRKFVVFKPSPC